MDQLRQLGLSETSIKNTEVMDLLSLREKSTLSLPTRMRMKRNLTEDVLALILNEGELFSNSDQDGLVED